MYTTSCRRGMCFHPWASPPHSPYLSGCQSSYCCRFSYLLLLLFSREANKQNTPPPETFQLWHSASSPTPAVSRSSLMPVSVSCLFKSALTSHIMIANISSFCQFLGICVFLLFPSHCSTITTIVYITPTHSLPHCPFCTSLYHDFNAILTPSTTSYLSSHLFLHILPFVFFFFFIFKINLIGR